MFDVTNDLGGLVGLRDIYECELMSCATIVFT